MQSQNNGRCDIGQAFSKESTIVWDAWGNCKPEPGSLDQTCLGTQSRNGKEVDKKGEEIRSFTETRNCLLTTDVVDGGYTIWGEWDDCSYKCYETTSRYRTCHDPTPCNGGNDCSDLGRDTLTKDCGPAAGQWTEWGSWSNCHMPLGVSGYGTGIHERYRDCTDPSPICGGDYCIGNNEMNENCRGKSMLS
ncbi:unnamed protein product [Mytilus coruscus]|uniref:HMCN n=1 Tax=Mytilus coruscus TaxID=42192 RepID=A0A6J8CBK4_MYTCO|nr:unnamed protein product [Mytilus coruscus]